VQFPGCAGLPTITVETLRACREIDLLLSAHTLHATTAALSLVGRNLEKRHDASDRETGAAPDPHWSLISHRTRIKDRLSTVACVSRLSLNSQAPSPRWLFFVRPAVPRGPGRNSLGKDRGTANARRQSERSVERTRRAGRSGCGPYHHPPVHRPPLLETNACLTHVLDLKFALCGETLKSGGRSRRSAETPGNQLDTNEFESSPAHQ
jgi:hypothetical protein